MTQKVGITIIFTQPIAQWEIVLMRVAEKSLTTVYLDEWYVILIIDIMRSQKYDFENYTTNLQENICILPLSQI